MKGKTPYYVRGLGYRKNPPTPLFSLTEHLNKECDCEKRRSQGERWRAQEHFRRLAAAPYPAWWKSFGAGAIRQPKGYRPGRIFEFDV